MFPDFSNTNIFCMNKLKTLLKLCLVTGCIYLCYLKHKFKRKNKMAVNDSIINSNYVYVRLCFNSFLAEA